MLVSCIMPTCDRRAFIPSAIACYLAQDWPDKELIVVDDGMDRVEDLLRYVSGAKYFFFREENLPAHRPRTPIGTKRNYACERASGEVIVHWDDDDWSAPERISDQVARLLESGKSVTGYHDLLFWDQRRNEASRYSNASAVYAAGSSLCYRREYWNANRFKPTSFGEDNDFVYRARDKQEIIAVDGGQMMVARTHEQNTSKRDARDWPAIPTSEIPAAFFQ